MFPSTVHRLAVFCLIVSAAAQAEPETLLTNFNSYAPEEDAPAYKQKAAEHGFMGYATLAYGGWNLHRNGMADRSYQYALLHTLTDVRLVKNETHGGTWLRAEYSGTWGLDRHTNRNADINEEAGTANWVHGDVFCSHSGGLPELSLMQYLRGGKVCIIGGIVNTTNYWDALSPANDSFTGPANCLFVSSGVLPLPDGTPGALAQVCVSDSAFIQFGAARTGTAFTTGQNPFRSRHADGFAVLGEYVQECGEDITFRVAPFYRHLRREQIEYGVRDGGGLVGSIEYAVTERATLFSRNGISFRPQDNSRSEFSLGLSLSNPLPTREKDTATLALGLQNGSKSDGCCRKREQIAEFTYRLQLTPYLSLMPHVQFINRPAYAESKREWLFGVQSTLSF